MGRVKSLPHPKIESLFSGIVYLENAWTSIQMITEGEAAILMETTLRGFGNHTPPLKQSVTSKKCDRNLIFFL